MMDRESERRVFKYLTRLFLNLVNKINDGIITGCDLRKILHNHDSDKKLNKKELATKKTFLKIIKGFLGNKKR